MSGVMIKMGIYGIVRTSSFLGPPPEWWGWLLLGIGLTSGVLGVLFAIAQHDLKRLLAYHSVENIGIIAIGLGIGMLWDQSSDSPMIAILGFGGGLLHVVNHSLFKGLLFLGAGAVAHASGTREIDKLGGLLKKMPWTGADVSDRIDRHLRSPAAQRFYQRISDLPGRVAWRRRHPTAGWRSPVW